MLTYAQFPSFRITDISIPAHASNFDFKGYITYILLHTRNITTHLINYFLIYASVNYSYVILFCQVCRLFLAFRIYIDHLNLVIRVL